MRNTILILTTCALFLFLASMSQAASRNCSTLLTGECVGCHEKEKFCDYLGKNGRFWKAMITLMESHGADLVKSEKDGLVSCLSEQLDDAKECCK